MQILNFDIVILKYKYSALSQKENKGGDLCSNSHFEFCSSHFLFVSVSFTGLLEEREGQRPPVSHRRVSPPGQYLPGLITSLFTKKNNKVFSDSWSPGNKQEQNGVISFNSRGLLCILVLLFLNSRVFSGVLLIKISTSIQRTPNKLNFRNLCWLWSGSPSGVNLWGNDFETASLMCRANRPRV